MQSSKLIIMLLFILILISGICLTRSIVMPYEETDFFTTYYFNLISFWIIWTIINYLWKKDLSKTFISFVSIGGCLCLYSMLFLLVVFTSSVLLKGILLIISIILQLVIFRINPPFKKNHLLFICLFIIGANIAINQHFFSDLYYLILVHLILLINSIYSFVSFYKQHSIWK